MSRSADVVLLVTHSGDHFTVERVGEALGRRGARPYRLDTDGFPSEVQLSADLRPDRIQHAIEAAGGTVRADEVIGIWTRKFWVPRLADDLDPRFRESCLKEARAALLGFMDGFHGVRWVNDINRAQEAENKLYQLRTALAVGLRIPRTLVSNHPDRVREFYAELHGAMVTKLMTPISVGMVRAPAFVYTSDVHEEDLADLGQLRHCPMMFQERIAKTTELRVAYVAGQTFTGAVDASRSATGQTDWRRAAPEECPWQRDELPRHVADRVVVFMNRLGLVYGALDVIRTPEGEHVFLEVNPAGEWGMLERDLEYPISAAIADALLDGKGG